MNLREAIKEDFGMDLPISGGTGNSPENAVVIEKIVPNHYVGYEYAYIKCICAGRGVSYKHLFQAVMTHKGKTIDKLTIETVEVTDTEIITQTENYYFDISACVNF